MNRCFYAVLLSCPESDTAGDVQSRPDTRSAICVRDAHRQAYIRPSPLIVIHALFARCRASISALYSTRWRTAPQ